MAADDLLTAELTETGHLTESSHLTASGQMTASNEVTASNEKPVKRSITKPNNKEESSSLNSCKAPPYIGSCRLTITIMCFFGTYHLMALRFNMSMAMVCMTADPTQKYQTGNSSRVVNYTEDNSCGGDHVTDADNQNIQDLFDNSREFSWSKPLQGALLSSFFYGYIVTQVAGGYFSDRWGGRSVLLLGMTILSLSTILIPGLARTDPHLVLVTRVIQGLASGIAFPSVYNMFTTWSHPKERATLMSICFAGIPTATVTVYPTVSALCESGMDGGWPLAFYIPGSTGLLWCILFYSLIYSSPQEHPRISPQELDYLSQGRKEARQLTHTVPWGRLIRSPAVHCLWVTHLCSAFGYYLIVINISLFIREALGFSVIQNGFLSMLPTLGMLILSSTGKLFDLLRSKSSLSVTSLRKLFNSVAFFVPAFCFAVLGLLHCSMRLFHVIVLSLGLTVHELAMTGGFYFSHSDIAGPHSGVLFGITNTFAQIPGFLTPVIVSYMTPTGELEEWYRVFLIASGVYIFGGTVYLIFGASTLQDWAKQTEETQHEGLSTSKEKVHV